PLRSYAASGAFCALGLYGYFTGRMTILALLAYLPFALYWHAGARRQVAAGYAVLVATTAVLFLPQLPAILKDVSYFNRRANSVLIFTNDKRPALQVLLDSTLRQLRGFVLLDGGVQNNARYGPPGRPILDPIAGTLFFLGLIAGVLQF